MKNIICDRINIHNNGDVTVDIIYNTFWLKLGTNLCDAVNSEAPMEVDEKPKQETTVVSILLMIYYHYYYYYYYFYFLYYYYYWLL